MMTSLASGAVSPESPAAGICVALAARAVLVGLPLRFTSRGPGRPGIVAGPNHRDLPGCRFAAAALQVSARRHPISRPSCSQRGDVIASVRARVKPSMERPRIVRVRARARDSILSDQFTARMATWPTVREPLRSVTFSFLVMPCRNDLNRRKT